MKKKNSEKSKISNDETFLEVNLCYLNKPIFNYFDLKCDGG